MNETPVTIEAPGAGMLGIVGRPDATVPQRNVGVVMVGGGAQYRIGSHRQCVSLSRRLAGEGFVSLRFDFPGLGDSSGDPVAFDQSEAHIGAAIDQLLYSVPQIDKVVLWGLCDGASACLLYEQACADARVSGLALLNPWIASEAATARAQVKHYYGRRVMTADFWRKLLVGGVGLRSAWELTSKLRFLVRRESAPVSFSQRMAMAWQGFGGRLLLMLSEHDLTAQAFKEHIRHDAAWHHWEQATQLTWLQLDGADHTCSARRSQQEMENRLIDWLKAA